MIELWVKYVALGGAAGLDEFTRWLGGDGPISRYEHDIIAVALTEHFTESGFGHPIDYAFD
jgi:hypothetical protein